MKNRKGQVVLYLVMVLVVAFLLALLNVDAFTAVRAKRRLQNGGDAAALAAAWRQGELINEIGNLNLDHIVAAIKDDAEECARISLAQRKIALLGPVRALADASAAAEENGLTKRKEFSDILRRHANDVRTVYAGGGGGDGDPYPEPYPGAWDEYAFELESVAEGGLAAGADNLEFYHAARGHILLERGFYQAVAASDWCWFFFRCYGTLKGYTSWRDWGPLPSREEANMDNSEVFSLHVEAVTCPLMHILDYEEINFLMVKYRGGTIVELGDGLWEEGEIPPLFSDPAQTWFLFDPGAWGEWFSGMSLHGEEDEDVEGFPVVGEVKPEYNVRGCAAVCRTANYVTAVATDATSDFTWAAAAKPFGFLVEDSTGRLCPATELHNFVMPCLSDARLVPVDSVGGSCTCTADYGWIVHVRDHLPRYLERGTAALDASCWWCAQLRTWEMASFRRAGVEWLKYNSGRCVRQTGGGGGSGGGTVHGH